ncbi:MAG TPA: hypothetical protein VLX85_15105 [Stellaceae bacterium]|nr:hypothetical protein [Stellaceae bacterium]
MRKLLLTAAVFGLAFAGAASDASAWSSKGQLTTFRGTFTHQGGGSCAAGTCSRAGSTVGPNGKSVSTQGSITRVAPGDYTYKRSITGPNGHTATDTGTINVTR